MGNPKEKCAFEVNLLVQTDQVGCVIGKGGQRIREIRDASSGKARVYQDPLPNSNERIVAIGGEDESRVLAAFDIIMKTLDDHPLKTQVRYYDPKNRDGPPPDHRGMGGGGGGPPPQHLEASGNSQMGGVGGLGNLGGLGGLGSLAGAAGILGQLGLGGLNSAALSQLGGNNALGALGALNGNMMGGGNDMGPSDRDYRGNDNQGYRGNDNQGNDCGGRRDNRGSGGRDVENRGFDADFGDMETETKITVPNDMAGAIIGKGGLSIKEIKQSSGARVDFSETEKGSKAPRTVTIKGTQRQIVIAQQMMAECVQNRNT